MMNSTFYEFINLYIAAFGLINKKLCIRFLRQMFSHHYTETEYLNGRDLVIDSICMQSEQSSDLSDISKVFETDDTCTFL